MVTVQANALTLRDVHQRLGYQRHYADRLDQFLTLTDLTPAETAELMNIRSEFDLFVAGVEFAASGIGGVAVASAQGDRAGLRLWRALGGDMKLVKAQDYKSDDLGHAY
jgi:hypothetical protein